MFEIFWSLLAATEAIIDPNALPPPHPSPHLNLPPTISRMVFGWNITSVAGAAIIMIIIGIGLFFAPKYFHKKNVYPFNHMFLWMGMWVCAEGLSRLNYILLLLNIDQTVPILYPLLPISRGFSFFLGFGALVIFIVLYSKLGQFNTIIQEREVLSKKFEALVTTANEAIVQANAAGIITDWNQAAEVIFGWTQEDAIGNQLEIIIPERLREAHRMGIKRFLQTGEKRLIGKTIEIEALHKNGNEFPVELSLGQYKVNEDIFFASIIRDISKRKDLEKTVVKQTDQKNSLIEINKELKKEVIKLEKQNGNTKNNQGH